MAQLFSQLVYLPFEPEIFLSRGSAFFLQSTVDRLKLQGLSQQQLDLTFEITGSLKHHVSELVCHVNFGQFITDRNETLDFCQRRCTDCVLDSYPRHRYFCSWRCTGVRMCS